MASEDGLYCRLVYLGTCSHEGLPRSCYRLVVLNFFCPLPGALADWPVNDGDKALGQPVYFPWDSGNLFGNREATVGFDESGLAGGLALIWLPLPFAISDGIDVVGFDVIGLAYGLTVIWLLTSTWTSGWTCDIGAMVSYIFTYRDSRTIRMLGCDVHN